MSHSYDTTDTSECSSSINSPMSSLDICSVCDPKKKYFNCICGKNWDTFEKHLRELESVEHELILKKISISTMTVCCNFNSHVDLDTIADLYVESVKYSPNAKKTKKTTKKDCFYNSLLMTMTTKYQTPNKISIKFFPNGKIQLAGCKSIMSCCYSIRKAFRRILKNDCFLDDAYISDTKIAMINSDFKINKCINQDALTDILASKSIDKNYNFLQVVYQSSKYPAINSKFIPSNKIMDYAKFKLEHGLKTKFPDVISILIFRPGSIIITGGNKIEDYVSAYNKILEIVNSNKHDIIY